MPEFKSKFAQLRKHVKTVQECFEQGLKNQESCGRQRCNRIIGENSEAGFAASNIPKH